MSTLPQCPQQFPFQFQHDVHSLHFPSQFRNGHFTWSPSPSSFLLPTGRVGETGVPENYSALSTLAGHAADCWPLSCVGGNCKSNICGKRKCNSFGLLFREASGRLLKALPDPAPRHPAWGKELAPKLLHFHLPELWEIHLPMTSPSSKSAHRAPMHTALVDAGPLGVAFRFVNAYARRNFRERSAWAVGAGADIGAGKAMRRHRSRRSKTTYFKCDDTSCRGPAFSDTSLGRAGLAPLRGAKQL